MSGREARWFVEPVYRDPYGQKRVGYTCARLGSRTRYCGIVHRTEAAAEKHGAKLSGGER